VPKKNPTPQANRIEQSFISKSTVLSLSLKWSDIEPVYHQVLSNLAKRVKSAGFRAGKVPPQVAEGIIGEEMVKEETAKKLLPEAYEKLITETKKKPITQPEFQAKKMAKGEDWELEVIIAERPEVNLKDHAKVVKTAKAEAKKLFPDEIKAFEQAEKEHHHDGSVPHTHQAPNEKEFTLQTIFRALLTTYKPLVPELLLKQETRMELDGMVKSLRQLNMNLDDYVARRGITFEQLSNDVAVQALGRLQLDLLYSALIADQEFVVQETDLDEFVKQIEDEKQRTTRRQDPEYLRYITPMILREKVSEYLQGL